MSKPFTAYDVQKRKLDKLMENPDKPVVIPERRDQRKFPDAPEFVRNIMGSSAGAGSGEFHVYRHLRRKEYARQKFIKDQSRKEDADEQYRQRVDQKQKQAEERTAKKRAKRLKKKERSKNKKEMGGERTADNDQQEDSDSDDQDGAAGAGADPAAGDKETGVIEGD